MSLFRDLLADVIKSGPENVKRVVEVLDKMPSDKTLNRLLNTMDTLSSYLPILESLGKVLGDGSLAKIESLVKNCPDKATLDRLMGLAPMLEKVPDKVTLNRLLDKAESLEGLLKSLDEVK